MKKLNFIIDVGVGISIEKWLTDAGYDVLSVRSINHEMWDDEIIKLATEKNTVIITMDKDFGELVFKNKLPHNGILLLRLEDAVSEEKLAALQNIIPYYEAEISNNFCVYQNGKLRIRK